MAGGRKRKKGLGDRSITSEESVVPDSDAAVARSIRMSETFAGPAAIDLDDGLAHGNHISH